MDHGTFKDLMEDAKGSDFKLRYLKQFYRKKLSEYEFRTGVPDGKFALPDKKIFEYKIQEIREKRRSEFEEWLGMKIEDINSSNMAHVMATLRKEIKIVNDERVVDFVRIIFFHSELKGRDLELRVFQSVEDQTKNILWWPHTICQLLERLKKENNH